MKKIIITSSIMIAIILMVVLLLFVFFPKKYKSEVMHNAKEYNLSPVLVASVINIESGYDESAISKAGAVGLMQLLPETAYDCADRLGMSVTYEELFDKSTNLMLGCYYLRYLLDLFDGNLVNSLCAYNWGLGNVRSWIELGNVDENGTITNIPVEETRDYLKKYRVCSWVYEKIYRY